MSAFVIFGGAIIIIAIVAVILRALAHWEDNHPRPLDYP